MKMVHEKYGVVEVLKVLGDGVYLCQLNDRDKTESMLTGAYLKPFVESEPAKPKDVAA